MAALSILKKRISSYGSPSNRGLLLKKRILLLWQPFQSKGKELAPMAALPILMKRICSYDSPFNRGLLLKKKIYSYGSPFNLKEKDLLLWQPFQYWVYS